MDVYTPADDTETDRPVILYFHTGNFLPQYVNGSAVGTRTDSSAVEICSRFARMGYVVASCDYRLGGTHWLRLRKSARCSSFRQPTAVYRTAAQRSVISASIAEDGNPWGANGDKIAMFGEGTGGYISLASSTIADYNDIIVDDMGNPITKFWYDPGDGSFIPMVIEGIHGDPNSDNRHLRPASSGGFGYAWPTTLVTPVISTSR